MASLISDSTTVVTSSQVSTSASAPSPVADVPSTVISTTGGTVAAAAIMVLPLPLATSLRLLSLLLPVRTDYLEQSND